MVSKRKYDPEDDFEPSENESVYEVQPKRARHQHAQPSRAPSRRTRQTRFEAAAGSSVRRNDQSIASAASDQPSRAEKRKARILHELVNLGDYNAPPKGHQSESNSKNISTRRSSRRTRKSAQTEHHLRSKGSRSTMSQPKPIAKPSKKRTREERARDEVADLRPWNWYDTDMDTEDSDDDLEPRRHSGGYPPKQQGVQNLPWSSLPGEIRNNIYEQCMANESQNVLNVHHYPFGVPRRSVRGAVPTTNFAHSYWGFTQTCREVRDELTSWLLLKRRIRTPLGTLDNYVDTFHRETAKGERIGWIEPTCTGAVLPGDGVDIFRLIEFKRNNADFHLQLTSTIPLPLQSLQDALPMSDWDLPADNFDELKIFKDIDHITDKFASRLSTVDITRIRITSVPKRGHEAAADEDNVHDILIKLTLHPEIFKHDLDEDDFEWLAYFMFKSQIAQHTGVMVEADCLDARVKWKVQEPGSVAFSYKEKMKGGSRVSRKLTADRSAGFGFRSEEL